MAYLIVTRISNPIGFISVSYQLIFAVVLVFFSQFDNDAFRCWHIPPDGFRWLSKRLSAWISRQLRAHFTMMHSECDWLAKMHRVQSKCNVLYGSTITLHWELDKHFKPPTCVWNFVYSSRLCSSFINLFCGAACCQVFLRTSEWSIF